MTLYRSKHAVEAMQWEDTEARYDDLAKWHIKKAISAPWLMTHGRLSVRAGHDWAILNPTDWLAWDMTSDKFIVLTDAQFRAEYEEVVNEAV